MVPERLPQQGQGQKASRVPQPLCELEEDVEFLRREMLEHIRATDRAALGGIVFGLVFDREAEGRISSFDPFDNQSNGIRTRRQGRLECLDICRLLPREDVGDLLPNPHLRAIPTPEPPQRGLWHQPGPLLHRCIIGRLYRQATRQRDIGRITALPHFFHFDRVPGVGLRECQDMDMAAGAVRVAKCDPRHLIRRQAEFIQRDGDNFAPALDVEPLAVRQGDRDVHDLDRPLVVPVLQGRRHSRQVTQQFSRRQSRQGAADDIRRRARRHRAINVIECLRHILRERDVRPRHQDVRRSGRARAMRASSERASLTSLATDVSDAPPISSC